MRLFSGQGRFFMGQYLAPNRLSDIGNCSSLILTGVDDDALRGMTDTIAQASDILPNYGQEQSFTAELDDLTAANLVDLLGATWTPVARATGQTTTFTSYKGFTFNLGTVLESVQSITSTGPITYTAGTDYVVNQNSISIPSGSTIIDAVVCTVNYVRAKYELVAPFTSDWSYRKVLVEGLNTADSNKKWALALFKVKIEFIKELPIISDSFATVKLVGKLLSDPLNSDRYYSLQQVE